MAVGEVTEHRTATGCVKISAQSVVHESYLTWNGIPIELFRNILPRDFVWSHYTRSKSNDEMTEIKPWITYQLSNHLRTIAQQKMKNIDLDHCTVNLQMLIL